MTGNDLLDRLAGLRPADALTYIRELGTIEAIAFVTFLVFTIAFFLWVAWLTIRR